MKKLEHTYAQLEIKVGLHAENPWKNSPMVRQAAALFLHQLLKNHTVRNTATTKHLPLYPQRLAEQAVNAVLGTPEASTSNNQPSNSGAGDTPTTHMAMVPTPVAGPALDELEQQNQERDTQIAELQQQKQKLEKRLVEIKQTVDTLAQEHTSIKAKLNQNDLLDKNTSTQANTQTHQHMLVVGVDRPSNPTRPQNTTTQQPNAQLLEVVRDLHGRVQLFEQAITMLQAELSLEQITRVAAHYLHGFAMNSVRLTPNNTWNVQLKGHNPMRKMHLLGLKWVSLEHQLTTLHGDRGNTPYQPMNELAELIHQLPSTHTLRAKLTNNPSNQQRLAEAMDEVLSG